MLWSFLSLLKWTMYCSTPLGSCGCPGPRPGTSLAPCLAKHQEWLPPSSGLRALQLWAQMQLCCLCARQLGPRSPAAPCPSPLTTCAFLGVAVRGGGRLTVGLILKARDNPLCKLRRCWQCWLLSLCACF